METKSAQGSRQECLSGDPKGVGVRGSRRGGDPGVLPQEMKNRTFQFLDLGPSFFSPMCTALILRSSLLLGDLDVTASSSKQFLIVDVYGQKLQLISEGSCVMALFSSLLNI